MSRILTSQPDEAAADTTTDEAVETATTTED